MSEQILVGRLEKTEAIRELKKQIKIESMKFHKTKNIVFLYQAAEKVWMAFTLYVEKLSGEESTDVQDTRRISNDLIKQKKIGYDLYAKAMWLHQWHYEGWMEDESLINNSIAYCVKRVKG